MLFTCNSKIMTFPQNYFKISMILTNFGNSPDFGNKTNITFRITSNAISLSLVTLTFYPHVTQKAFGDRKFRLSQIKSADLCQSIIIYIFLHV